MLDSATTTTGALKRMTVSILATQVVLAALNFPATFVIARTLGPEGLGTYQLLYRFAFIAISVVQLGYIHAFAWEAARSSDPADLRLCFRRAVHLSLTQGSAVLVLALAALFWGAHEFGTSAWILIASYPLVNLLAANLANCYRGMLSPGPFIAVRVSQALIWVLLVVGFAASGLLTVTTTIIALVAAQAASAVVGLVLTAGHGLLKRPRVPSVGRRARAQEVRHFAHRAWLGMLIRDFNVYLDQIIVGLFLDTRQLGLYAAAVSLTMTLGLLGAPITNAMQPSMQRASSLDDQRRRAGVSIAYCALGVGTAGACVAITAGLVVPLLYGQAFAASIVLVQILSIAATVDNVNSCLHGILLGLGQPGKSSRSTGLGLAVSVVGWILALPTLGILGAALTSVVAYVVVLYAMFSSVASALQWRRRDLMGECGRALCRAPAVLLAAARTALVVRGRKG